MIRFLSRILLGSLLVVMSFTTACTAFSFATPSPTPTPTPTITLEPTITLTPTPIPPTATPTITPTPTWVWQAAGEVTCPILLYHQISDDGTLYYVSPADFQVQMQALHDWGYTAIPISLLVQAITGGANLPPRPIVITFDDGDENVYLNAFPVMQALGFPGVLYIVSSWLNGKDHLNTSEILEMVAAGWEVGNHSTSHVNLQDNPGLTYDQAVPSRKTLKAALGLPIDTFAYPNGAATGTTMEKISSYGYKAAVGLANPIPYGENYIQGPNDLFYLSRIEIPYNATLDQFATLLPWSGPIQ